MGLIWYQTLHVAHLVLLTITHDQQMLNLKSQTHWLTWEMGAPCSGCSCWIWRGGRKLCVILKVSAVSVLTTNLHQAPVTELSSWLNLRNLETMFKNNVWKTQFFWLNHVTFKGSLAPSRTLLCSLSLCYRERPGLILQHCDCSIDQFPAVPLLTSRLSQWSRAGGHGEPNKEMFTAYVIQSLQDGPSSRYHTC